MVRIHIILFLIICSQMASAQKTLNIHTRSNGIISMPFSMKPQISFNKGNVITIVAPEKTIEYPFSDVEQITFDDSETDEPEDEIYTITYIIDGEVYQTTRERQGNALVPMEVSPKEGYTFSGWSEFPETMPAKDLIITGMFIPNKYTITYLLDGETYKTYNVSYGAAIIAENEPTKEGFTFSGWDMIPATMPAKDVIVRGSFTQGEYKLIYVVDGQTYKTISMDFGLAIIPEEEPAKEGYTFSGWGEIPATMPAKDVTVTGSFTVNKYNLTYMLDDEIYKTYQLEFEASITAEPDPIKNGYAFNGWSEIPSIMPAKDVTITGSFTYLDAINDINSKDGYGQIYTIDGKPSGVLYKGLNIIRMKNGKMMKVFVK